MAEEDDSEDGSSWLDAFSKVASTATSLAGAYSKIRQTQQQQLFPNYGATPRPAVAPAAAHVQAPQQQKSFLQMIIDFFMGRS